MRKIIIGLLVVGFMFGKITKIETEYGDSTTVRAFHENGNLNFEGIKIKKFRDGKWKYYDESGSLIRIENYKFGRKIRTMEIGALK